MAGLTFSYAQETMITISKLGQPDKEVYIISTITHLMEARKNNFKDIKTNLIQEDAPQGIKYYATEETFGGSVEVIMQNDKAGSSNYYSSFDLSDQNERKTAILVVNDIVKYINLVANNSESAKFTAEDISYPDGEYITKLKTKEGELIMDLITTAGEKEIKIFIYGAISKK